MLWSIWVPVTPGRKGKISRQQNMGCWKKSKKRERECPVDRMVTKQKIRCMSNQNIPRIKILVQEGWSSPEHRSQVTGTQGTRKQNFKMKRGLEEHMVYKHGIAMSNEDMEILGHQVKMLRRIKK